MKNEAGGVPNFTKKEQAKSCWELWAFSTFVDTIKNLQFCLAPSLSRAGRALVSSLLNPALDTCFYNFVNINEYKHIVFLDLKMYP